MSVDQWTVRESVRFLQPGTFVRESGLRRVIRNGFVNGVVRGFTVLEGDRILAVGEEPDAGYWIRPGDAVHDAEGAWILPAFIDSHIHVFGLAREKRLVDLHGIDRIETLVERLREAPQASGDWLLGTGWDETLLGRLPDRLVLDRFFPDRPVFLWRRCLHIAAANRLALERAGLGPGSTVQAGSLDRFEDGSLTGILREAAAHMVARQIPEPTWVQTASAVRTVLEDLAAMGIASVSTNDGTGSGLEPWETYLMLLGTRENGATYPEVFWDPPLAALDTVRTCGLRSFDGREGADPDALAASGVPGLRMGAIKFVTDGSLGGRTAYMLSPYAGEEGAGHRGLPRLSPDELAQGIRTASETGLRVCLHAIGDAAARDVLEALKAVGRHVAVKRPRIIHSQFVTEEDRKRYREVGAIADVQPLFAVSDLPLRERVGEAFRYGYAWRRLLLEGAHMAFGSDAPVESPNPILGVRAARYRGGARRDIPGWDGERLDLATALRLYSEGGAYAQASETLRGRLLPGQRADVVVVNPSLFDVEDGPASAASYRDRPNLRPRLSVLGGSPVQADAFETVRPSYVHRT